MRVLVVFESTLGRTRAMAIAICDGVRSQGIACDLVPADEFTSLEGACAVAFGSSTRIKRPLPKIREILSELGSMEGMPAASFGSYGWSGEAPDIIAEELTKRGAVLISKPVKAKDYPDEISLGECRALGVALARSCHKE
ncbi:MAG: flavodoxin domain-containing protein [Candidatus Thorarchaeota archaeon]